MTVFAVFAAIALVFALYFQQPECRLRGETPCAEAQEPLAETSDATPESSTPPP